MLAVPAVLPALISGALLAHIFWPDRGFWALVTKTFLGVGIGLGMRSLLYFLYLLVLPGRNLFVYLELASLVCLMAIAVRLQRLSGKWEWSQVRPARLTGSQWALVPARPAAETIAACSRAVNYRHQPVNH